TIHASRSMGCLPELFRLSRIGRGNGLARTAEVWKTLPRGALFIGTRANAIPHHPVWNGSRLMAADSADPRAWTSGCGGVFQAAVLPPTMVSSLGETSTPATRRSFLVWPVTRWAVSVVLSGGSSHESADRGCCHAKSEQELHPGGGSGRAPAVAQHDRESHFIAGFVSGTR